MEPEVYHYPNPLLIVPQVHTRLWDKLQVVVPSPYKRCQQQILPLTHIGRKSQNECAVITSIGNRDQKALWDSGVGRCVISYECYNRLHSKYKTELFSSQNRIRAANGTFIPNRGECDITFEIPGVGFTFPFLCSDQLSQDMILGLNFQKAYHIGTYWMPDDSLYLTLNGETFAETEPIHDLNALIFCAETTIIPPFQMATYHVRCQQ